MAQWQLREAKTRFSEVIEEAHTQGPQIITRDVRGIPVKLLDPWKE